MERREFLRGFAVAVVGGAFLAACTDGDNGVRPAPGSSTTTTTAPPVTTGAAASDLTLIRTTASLAALVATAYRDPAAVALTTSPELRTLATAFAAHHDQHVAALNGVLAVNGTQPIRQPNAVLQKSIAQPALAAATTEDELVQLVFTLEDATAQTLVYAGRASGRADLRATFLTMAGIDARHRTLLGVRVQAQPIGDLFPSPFARDDNPLPPDALLS